MEHRGVEGLDVGFVFLNFGGIGEIVMGPLFDFELLCGSGGIANGFEKFPVVAVVVVVVMIEGAVKVKEDGGYFFHRRILTQFWRTCFFCEEMQKIAVFIN